ncbi:MAG: peptidoglycan D,D-transpeptidase FtsI family protein [Actinomycetota bacterium]
MAPSSRRGSQQAGRRSQQRATGAGLKVVAGGMRRRGGRTRSKSPSRLVAMFFLLVIAFGAMVARLFVLQIVEAPEYARIAADQRQRDIPFPARRGTVFDRTGEPLAISVDLKLVFADPEHVEDPVAAAQALAPVLNKEVDELLPLLQGTPSWSRFEVLAHQVEPHIAGKIRRLAVPGVYLKDEPKRYYPEGKLASHVLGFVNLDGTVHSGVESQYQEILEGTAGHMTLEQDPTGRPLPQAEFSYEPPRPGRSLFLTIDKELQYYTELTLADAVERYKAEAGTAIVMQPETGEILAIANVPDFDPNNYSKASQESQRNRALTDVYEPGSAFKVVTMAAALEEGVVTPRSVYTVPDAFQYLDRVFNDSHSHPTEQMTVAKILEQSSNVGTIKIGLDLGEELLDSWIRRFGFGRETGLDFPGEASGIVLPRKLWSGTTIATLPIGQGIAVTPVQMAAAYSAIANDGIWTEPKLLHSTMDGTGEITPSSTPRTRRIFSEETAKLLQKMLHRVVEKGTGIEAQIPGFEVAGKTGTAQKALPTGGYGNSYIGSFAGFAPVSDPKVVVLVTLDEPSPIWGGSTAAPTFQAITEFALRQLGVAPQGNAEKAAKVIEAEQARGPVAHD